MATEVDVVIIGTGTAALAAAAAVSERTSRFIIASNGVYGTTCVRAGCMPAKVLLQAAELCHARSRFAASGIRGAEHVKADIPAVLARVRAMRAHFLEHTLAHTETYRDRIVEGKVRFREPAVIEVGGEVYRARRVVLATGSRPVVPAECEALRSAILTSDDLFEQEDLPAAMGVLGLSVLGAEIAQALARLGIQVTAAHSGERIGGLTDPAVSAHAVAALRDELDVWLGRDVRLEAAEGAVRMAGEERAIVEKVFVARSRAPNLEGMGLEELGILRDGCALPQYDPRTMKVDGLPLFIAGDVKAERSLLNEAADEGRIAGYNAAREEATPFRRRAGLQISYTDPTIAIAGRSWEELASGGFVAGEASFADQGRAKVMGYTYGIVRIYGDPESGALAGAEMCAPDGEHLGHQLAWLIDRGVTVWEALQLPFYHPSLEEGLKSALEDLASQIQRPRYLP